MPSERDLRRRARSIKNIQQLTRAMQLVAASKMRRAQEAVLASRPFEEKLRSVLNDLAPYADPELIPLLARRDVKKIAVPVLVMHGDDDQIVPYADSAPLSAKLLKNSTLKTYKGFPHGMPTTEAATINAALLAFLKA